MAPTLIWGRETLRSLARHTGGWIGWETATRAPAASRTNNIATRSHVATRTATCLADA
ncbi:MAG TPA: hypothetical protein VGM77_04410 [Gemmatimonadales bacterium]